MKKFLIATLLCMALTVTMVPMAFAADSNYTECMAAIQEQRTIQDQAHQTAESLRKKGYSDSSAYVQAAKSTWNEAQKAIAGYQKLAQYSDEDIRILTTTVFHEAGHTPGGGQPVPRHGEGGHHPARPVFHQVCHSGGGQRHPGHGQ